MKSFYFNQNIKVKIYENFNLLKDEIVNLFIKEFNKGLCIVSGGNTPKKIYEKISTSNDLGANIKILLADDRLVSNSNEMSNYQMLLNNLLIDYKNNYPISYYDELELSNLKSLQKKVEIILKKNKIYSSFLGIGEDGHTASLFPEIANFKTDFNSFIIKNDFDNFKRFTLSYKTIMMSKKIIFIVTGHKKNKILLDFFRGNHSFDKHPFHMIAANHKNVEFHCDIEAGKNLKL